MSKSIEQIQDLSPLKIVVVGQVDHGKSSLIARLLVDAGASPSSEKETAGTVFERGDMATGWSFAPDVGQAERDRVCSSDVTKIEFKTPLRDYVIFDTPGHDELLRSMVSGAANADGAVLVIDAAEGLGVQSRRHAYLLHLLGIRQLAVAVTKMDLVKFDQVAFDGVANDISRYLGELGITPVSVVPVAVGDGDNMATASTRTAWYQGPSLLQALDRFQPVAASAEQPLRLPVQEVHRFDERRIVVGRIESGRLRVGDSLLFSPSNKSSSVHAIEAWQESKPPAEATAGALVGITLEDQIFVERGEMISHQEEPPYLTTVFRATLFWLGDSPLMVGNSYKLRLATREANVTVQSIDRIIDTDNLAARAGDQTERYGVAEVVLRSRKILAVDEHRMIAQTGCCLLLDGEDTVGGGVISMEGYPDQRDALTIKSTNITSVEHRVDAATRQHRNGHCGGVLWFTGLSGAGKSTIAMAVEQHLFRQGYHTYVLDGDNVRHGLNANLGFSPADRAENIRRVGEMATLFADAGMICITAFISPYQSDRDRARKAAGSWFHEIYIEADLETCESRDPKGLYRKARAGEIAEFTGISAPYEAPAAPELRVDTAAGSIEDCVKQVADYVDQIFTLKS